MKKLYLIGIMLLVSGCTSFHTGKDSLIINPDVKHNLSASLEVGDKITGIAECPEYLFFIKPTPEKQAYIPSMMSKAGNLANDECTAGAVYDAVSKNDADMLVEPQYTTVKNGFLCTFFGCFYSNTKIIVTGYAAKIKKIY